MNANRWSQIEQLYHDALRCAESERAEFLRKACAGDGGLLREVETLLAANDEAENFLVAPAFEIEAREAARAAIDESSGLLVSQQLGHYQILSLLGEGGMGEVYLAEDTNLRRRIALKVLPAMIAQDKYRLRRFEQEAFAASALNHPNILTIYEFGAKGETYYLASELIDGETLRNRLQRAPLSLDEALDIAMQTTQALVAAHEAGIIHRDIKPENVMLRNDGIVKVLDFGLAKLTERRPDSTRRGEEADTLLAASSHPSAASLTMPGTVMGTVAYMSPEQARGRPLDVRTDLFSLGVMFYEMLAGCRPFTGETSNHIIVAILEKDPPLLSQSGNVIPARLEQIVRQALAKNVEDRYQSAKDLLADLKKIRKRLDFEAEFEGASFAPGNNETPDAHNKTSEQPGQATRIYSDTETLHESGEVATITLPPPRAEKVTDLAQTSLPGTFRADSSARLWVAVALIVLMLAGFVTWQWTRSTPAVTPGQIATTLPERRLSYSLTVQEYRDGKPYQKEYQSSGREGFGQGWKFRLNVSGSQEGFLYLLNEESATSGGNYVLLFPLPSYNNGQARLAANELLRTAWYVFDNRPGTEKFRLVWAEKPVPELEAVRGFVNPRDQGRITDAPLSQAIRTFIQQAAPVVSADNLQERRTEVSGRSAALVALVELEHH